MRVKIDKLCDAYQQIKHTANAEGSSVLICVAGDIDAIAASHIFTVLFASSSNPVPFSSLAILWQEAFHYY